jgi:hypothetical protein
MATCFSPLPGRRVRNALLCAAASLTLFLNPSPASAQDPPATRAAEIEEARRKKAESLQPESASRAEQFFVEFKDKKVLERISAGVAGVRLKLGGLVTGGGFALGPEYLREDIGDGALRFRAAAQSSFARYHRIDMQFGSNRLSPSKFFFDTYAVRNNFPGINYYGPGPDSAITGRSNFRLEETAFDGLLGLQPFRHLRLGASGGFLMVNTGPGTDRRLVSAEQIYTAVETPGIAQQSNFGRVGGFVQFDYRDNPGGPRNGGNYMFHLHRYTDRTLDRHNFTRIDLEAQQYIPFFNRRRVIALRGKTVMNLTDAAHTVPFYLQPVLGGSDDLRGFRPFRFYGDNLLVMNAEYRWEIFSGLDMALFADAGKVATRRSQLDFSDLESSVGFGFRFNVRNNVFLRLDTAFSHEGFQVWFKFNPIFNQHPRWSSATYPGF